jgi:hypothetical protein
MNGVRKHEVYSWRPSSKLKEQLEAAAREEKTSVDALLNRIVRAWLAARAGGIGHQERAASMERSGFSEGAHPYVPAPDDAGSAVSRRRASAPLHRRRRTAEDDAEDQRRLREQLLRAAGTVSIGLGPYTNERVREIMGEQLEKKYRASQRRAPRRSR